MRHRIYGRKLSRDKNSRKALFKSLISSLVVRGQIKTTEPRAKAVKGLVDRLISYSKQKTLHGRRLVAAFLQNKNVVNKLVDEVAPKFVGRTSGFTRILRLGKRSGDKAMMVKMEFVTTQNTDKEAIATSEPSEPKQKEDSSKNPLSKTQKPKE